MTSENSEDDFKVGCKSPPQHSRFQPGSSGNPGGVIRRTEDGGAELMFGSQLQTVDQAVAAKVLGLKPEQVKIKTVLAGGSFGRRATPAGDMAAEAAHVLFAAKHKGRPKLSGRERMISRAAAIAPFSCTS
jgi:CO/xanthine dehydrogenase Mo-binding subunit